MKDVKGNNWQDSQPVDGDVVDFNLMQVATYLYTHRLLLLIFATAFPAFVGVYTFFIKKPTFQAQTLMTIDFSARKNTLQNQQFSSSWLEEKEVESKLQKIEQFFHSNSFREALVGEVLGSTNLISSYKNSSEHKQLLRRYFFKKKLSVAAGSGRLLSGLQVVTISERQLISIRAHSLDPLVAQALAGVAGWTLIELNYQDILKRVHSVIQFLETQTEETGDYLETLEANLISLQKKHGIVSLDVVKNRSNSRHFDHLYQKTELEKKKSALKSLQTKLRADLNILKFDLLNKKTPSMSYLSQLRKRLEVLQYQKAFVNSGPGAEEKVLQAELDTILSSAGEESSLLSMDPWQLLTTIEKSLVDADSSLRKVESDHVAHLVAIARHNRRFSRLPKTIQEIGALQRSIDLQSELFRTLKSKLQENKISEAGEANDLAILAEAEVPQHPSGMGIFKRLIFSGVFGLIVGAVMLFLRFILVPLVRDLEDLEKVGLKVVGRFPWYKPQTNSILGVQSGPPLVIKEEPNSVEANSIRYARFKLERVLGFDKLNLHEGKAKIVTTLSVNSNEGKSFTTANLAYALAASDLKVLAMDLDLMQPNLASYFGSLKASEDNAIINEDTRVQFQLRTVGKNLDVIDAPRISENVCDFLESEMFYRFLNALREDYDVILIDTPPLEGHLEPLLAAQHSDAVVMVVNQRKTLIEDLSEHYKSITDNWDGPVLSILNFAFEDIKPVRKFGNAA